MVIQDDAISTYQAINMVLVAHSDASYLSKNRARGRVSGHFFLFSNAPIPPDNGVKLTVAQVIKTTMTSVAKAELEGLCINAREAVHIRNILAEIG